MRIEKEVTTISGIENSIERQLQTSLDQQIIKLKKILDENPGDLSVLMAYAEANLRKGNRLEAMRAYQKVVKIKPEVPEVRIALAKIYISLKHYQDAYNEVVRIFEINEKEIEGHILLKQLLRLIEIPADLHEALEVHIDFKAPPHRIKILQTLYDLEKRKYSRLINDYKRQLEEDEGDPIVMYQRKKAQERLEMADQALKDLEAMMGEPEEEEVPVEIEKIEYVEEVTIAEAILPAVEEVPSAEEVKVVEESPAEETEIKTEEVSEETAEEATEPPKARDTGELDEQIAEAIELVAEEEQVEEIEVIEPVAERIPEPELVEPELVEPEEKTMEEFRAEELDIDEPIGEISAIPLEELAGIEAIPIEEMVEEAVPELAETPEAEEVIVEEEEVKEKPTLSQERLAFYDEVMDEADRVLKALNRTRGVVSSLILDNTGHILHVLSSENFNPDDLGSQVLQGVSPLIKWGTDTGEDGRELLYWVLEFKKGLMVLQPLTPEVYLIVLGKRGANFGAVRYSIEKNTGKLLSVLSNLPG